MTPESMQDQAALYVLGQLDAEEAAAFERELSSSAELRTLIAELRDASSVLARADGNVAPPPELRRRVLEQIAVEMAERGASAPVPGEPVRNVVVIGPWFQTRISWALAACLLVCCGALAYSRAYWQQKYFESDRQLAATAREQGVHQSAPDASSLRNVLFCPLQPVKDATLPQTAVLWDPVKGEGELHVTRLAHPREGEDYQLWVVEEGRKEPVSAGVVKLDAGGNATTPFCPLEEGKALAFAVSIERAGGSPTNKGPIVFLGKL